MIISSSFIAILNLGVKGGLSYIPILELSFYRCFLPLLLMLPFLFIRRAYREILHPETNLRMHLARSFCAVVGQLSIIYYLTKASLLDATILWCTGPLFIPVIAHFFFKQKIPLISWISIVLGFVGVAFIIKPTNGIFDPFSFYGLLGGFSAAFSQLLFGLNVEKGKTIENLFYLYLFASLFTVFPSLFAAEETPATWNTMAFLAVGLVGVASNFNQLFRSWAYQYARPALLAPFLYFSVIVSAFFDWVFFHVRPDSFAYVGFFLVLLSSFIKWYWIKKNEQKIV